MKYIIMVSDKSPMFDWRGWLLLAPMCGLTDVIDYAYIYSVDEINNSLYLSDNIKHKIFELIQIK